MFLGTTCEKLSSRETGYSIHKENHTDFGRESWNFIKVNDVITFQYKNAKKCRDNNFIDQT